MQTCLGPHTSSNNDTSVVRQCVGPLCRTNNSQRSVFVGICTQRDRSISVGRMAFNYLSLATICIYHVKIGHEIFIPLNMIMPQSEYWKNSSWRFQCEFVVYCHVGAVKDRREWSGLCNAVFFVFFSAPLTPGTALTYMFYSQLYLCLYLAFGIVFPQRVASVLSWHWLPSTFERNACYANWKTLNCWLSVWKWLQLVVCLAALPPRRIVATRPGCRLYPTFAPRQVGWAPAPCDPGRRISNYRKWTG